MNETLSGWGLWLTMLAMGVITFVLRASFIALSGRFRLPPALARALRFVPAAVLSAIVVPALVFQEGRLELTLGNEKLLAGLLAGVVAWATKSVIWTLLAGMAALWTLQAVF